MPENVAQPPPAANRKERRAAKRLKLTKYRRWVEVPEFPGEKVQINPCTFYDLLQLRDLEADESNPDLWPVVSTLIADWTFADDDGAKLPLTAEAVRNDIPVDVTKAAIAAAMEAISGARHLPFAPTPSPASSMENHASAD